MTIVLFACVHNAGRSQMAAAFFNHWADPSKARALSAGTRPGDRVHPEVVDVLREKDIDVAQVKPQQLTGDLARQAGWLITMGCGDECPVVPEAKREDWALEDPRGLSRERVRQIRDDIERRVRELLMQHRWLRTE